jgi:hypothetical protein
MVSSRPFKKFDQREDLGTGSRMREIHHGSSHFCVFECTTGGADGGVITHEEYPWESDRKWLRIAGENRGASRAMS